MSAVYNLRAVTPSIDTYRHLRAATGLSPKTEDAARKGLAGGIYDVLLYYGEDIVGMGRLIGDGGCHFQIVDIAVLPEHQGKGQGKRIMAALTEYIDNNLPESAYISLIADGPAKHLYEQFGFKATAPVSIGMAKFKR